MVERVGADGKILEALDTDSLPALVEAVRASGAESVAVSLLFAFANPAHERAVGKALASLQDSHAALAPSLPPEFREYERASTVSRECVSRAAHIAAISRGISSVRACQGRASR